MEEKNHSTDHPKPCQALVLFDGFCELCNKSVDFIIKRDRKRIFCFVSLQSGAGEYLKEKFNLNEADDSVILWKDGSFYYQSDAALKIASELMQPWPLLGIFLMVPRPVRDPVYRFIARHRYSWFGKREACRLPSPEERHLFPSRAELELRISLFVQEELS